MATRRTLGNIKHFTKWVLLAVILLVGATVASAQETATILGTVKDASGAAVAGANVTARNTDTQATRQVVSEADGNYRIPGLQVGNYEVRVEHEGFQVEVHTGLVLTVDLQAVVSFTLQVGSVSQTVEVTGEAPLVDTTTSSLGGLVDSQRMTDLPLNGRNYIDLSLMQVGVIDQENGTHNIGYVGSYVVSNGATVRSNNYLLDGANMTNAWGVSSASVTNSTLGVDGIKEYKVITNSIPAEFGMTMGSQMTMVSKGGTNSFHGDAFEYLRNSAMDARNFFDTTQSSGGKRLPEFQRNQFGGSVGGPILKDKVFFNNVYEGLRANTGITLITKVVPASCLLASGATFPAPTPYNIANQTNCVADTGSKPCPANPTATSACIPTTLLSPELAPFLALDGLYPANSGTALAGGDMPNFAYAFKQPAREDYGQSRVDEVLSNKDSMFERWTVEDSIEPIPGAFPGWYTSAQDRTQFISISEDHIFSPTILNTLRAHFSRTSFYWAGITPSIASDPTLDCIPNFRTCGSGISGLTGPSTAGNRRHKQNLFTESDDVFVTRGKNSFKFGALFNQYLQVITNGGGCCGTQSFSSMANFLLANPTSVTVNAGPDFERTYEYTTLGFYGQDDYRLTSRITLNLGLRYEFLTTPYEAHHEWSVITNLATDTGYTVTPFVFQNPSHRNFSPRVGFAWDIFGNGKTALRGGFAQLFDIGGITAFLLQTQNSTPPYSQRLENTPTLGLPVGGSYTLPLPFPPGSSTALTYAGNPAASLLSPRPTDWYMKQARMYQYNLGIEQQLPWNMALTVAYAGSRGYNLPNTQEGNPVIPQGVPGANGTCVLPPAGHVPNTNSMIDGSGATACWLAADANNANPTNGVIIPGTTGARTNPNFGSMDLFTDRALSWYNSAQITIIKSLSYGLQFQSSYTYSKTVDTQAGAAFAENTASQAADGDDTFNINNERGPTVYDLPNVWKFNVLYNVPGLQREGIVGGVTKGWRLSSITTVQSGFPFSVGLNTERSNSGVENFSAGVDRPDYSPEFTSVYNLTHGVSAGCPGVAKGTPLGTPALYFDPCAFSIPNVGFLGDVGRNTLRGPNLRGIDFSVTKDTPLRFLGEAGNLEFRAEFFNILNRANFAIPGRTVFNGAITKGVSDYTIANNGAVETALEKPFSGGAEILSSTTSPGTVTSSRQVQLALKVIF
jgi:hypothetical protein